MRVNRQQMHTAIRDLVPAELSSKSMRIEEGAVSAWSMGRLPAVEVEEYGKDRLLITHTVFSYQTPIAWRKDDGTWVIPDVTYSRTTSAHQSIVRVATSAPDSYFDRPSMRLPR